MTVVASTFSNRQEQGMSTPNVTQLGTRIRFAYDKVRNKLLGHAASVIGRQELAGTIIGISLNPNGVVIATLLTAKPHSRRLRLPLDALEVGPPVQAAPVRQRHPRVWRKRPSPSADALRNGKLVLPLVSA